MAAGILETRNKLEGLGGTRLRDLVIDGYTRTLASDGLARVNPFQVEAGRAADPDAPGPPYPLLDWETYQHAGFPQLGSELSVEAGYGQFTASWSRPAGYTRDLANVNQRIYWKDMGTSEDTNVNPFSSPTGSELVGDGTEHTVDGVLDGHYYAVGVKQEWDDSDEIHDPGDADAYFGASGETLLLGPGNGVSSGQIASVTPPTPTTQQLTDSENCAVGDTDVEVRCNYSIEGPGPMTLERQINNSGTWSAVATGITTNGVFDDEYGGNDFVEFRTFYEDVSPRTYSAVADRQIQCDNV